MGGRLLRRWLLFPLDRRRAPSAAATTRSSGWSRAHAARDAAARVLGEVADLERLVGARAPRRRDAARSGRCWAARWPACPRWRAALATATPASWPARWRRARSLLSLGDDLGAPSSRPSSARVLRADAPRGDQGRRLRQRRACRAELDELRDIAAGGRDRIAAIEARERERTGIPSLKVRFNSVFGYYIEVTHAHLASVPADYVRKQTVANAERFVTPELAEFEQQGPDRRRAADRARAGALRGAARAGRGARPSRLLALAAAGRDLDALAALAEVAHRRGYCRPEVDDGGVIELADGRHPVVERLAAAGAFVPNDVRLDPTAEQLLLITGPNMAGKSTLHAPGGADRHPGADGQLRAGARARASASAIACSRASARATTSRAASRRSWSRCARPRTSSATRPRAA